MSESGKTVIQESVREVLNRTADGRGRVYLRKEYAGEEIRVAVLEESDEDAED